MYRVYNLLHNLILDYVVILCGIQNVAQYSNLSHKTNLFWNWHLDVHRFQSEMKYNSACKTL